MATLNNQNTLPSVVEIASMFMSTSGGATFYVGTTAQVALLGDTGASLAGRTFSTVNLALAACVSGRGDVIYCLPGYTENIGINAWSNLAATDVTIIGMGRGTNRPTFTWTATGSTMLFNVANFRLMNCNFALEPTTGSVNVAAPITVSAAGCAILGCKMAAGTDANNKITIGVTTTSGATDFEFGWNTVRGAALATMTCFLRLTGCANPYVHDNDIILADACVDAFIEIAKA